MVQKTLLVLYMAYFKYIYTCSCGYINGLTTCPSLRSLLPYLTYSLRQLVGEGVAAAPLPMPTPTHHSTYAYVTKRFLFFQWFWYSTLILAMPKGLIFSPEHVLNIVLIGFSWSSLASFHIAERSSN